ncbi:MAG: diaminopropionate ammonia-lyase, partial [Pseudomonadota bacterium]
GVGAVWYKDEAQRFGLGSFKPLGAGFALAKAIAARLRRDGIAGNPTVSDVVSGRYRDATRAITVVSATDGNHGRALAWAGRRFDASVEIIVHNDVSPGRRAAMEALGANVTVSAGNYDETVREAFALGEAFDWVVVQDTSAGTYRAVPIDICHGYGIIAEEMVAELEAPLTHVIVQAGVGGLASALCAQFWRHYGRRRPKFLTLEPASAACVAESLAVGKPVTVESEARTMMAGLDCGEVSQTAWQVLATGADGALVIGDGLAIEGMRRLAHPPQGEPRIVAGECAGGAVGALLALGERPHLKRALQLGTQSSVLIIGTEGATDPAIYRSVVGDTLAPTL